MLSVTVTTAAFARSNRNDNRRKVEVEHAYGL